MNAAKNNWPYDYRPMHYPTLSAILQTDYRRPTREQIEKRAYEIYLGRGRGQGHDVEDWLQAERELTELIRFGK